MTVFFADLLLRGNRSVKVHADSYHGFASPNLPPLATAGVTIDFASTVIREPSAGPIRRSHGMSSPWRDAAPSGGRRVRPRGSPRPTGPARTRPRGLRWGTVRPRPWFLDPLRSAADRGVVVVVTMVGEGVVGGRYATGSALLGAGAVPGGDMTFEAALTKAHGPLGRSRRRRRAAPDAAGPGRRAEHLTLAGWAARQGGAGPGAAGTEAVCGASPPGDESARTADDGGEGLPRQ